MTDVTARKRGSAMRPRGEFKTPGGKLIAVEFDIVSGALRGVVVTGDFFLYPEEALPLLSGALEDQPATLPEHEYASLVRSAVADVELLGASPEALARAVTRALAAAGDSPERDG